MTFLCHVCLAAKSLPHEFKRLDGPGSLLEHMEWLHTNVDQRGLSEEMTKITHIHYWLIEPASGPVSKGRCSSCGLERDFWNSFAEDRDGYDWAAHRGVDIVVSERWAKESEKEEV